MYRLRWLTERTHIYTHGSFLGVCKNIKGVPNDFTCSCPEQPVKFSGRRCEYGKYCQPDRCGHGGTCIEGPKNYTCMCSLGYTGNTSLSSLKLS